MWDLSDKLVNIDARKRKCCAFFFCDEVLSRLINIAFKVFLRDLKIAELWLWRKATYLNSREQDICLQTCAFVPEVILEFPHLVKQKYTGSDVVLALTVSIHSANLE